MMNKYNWMTKLSINDLIDKIGNYWDDDINNDDVQNEFFYAKSYCKLRVADLLMEIERLKAINTQIEWVCAYCGERFLHTIDAATEHILECEKHPLYQAKRHIAELEAQLADAKKIIEYLEDSPQGRLYQEIERLKKERSDDQIQPQSQT